MKYYHSYKNIIIKPQLKTFNNLFQFRNKSILTKLPFLLLFLFFISDNFAQSPAYSYADSMMATYNGISMYNDFLDEAPLTEDTSSSNANNYAYNQVLYYYIHEWYNYNCYPLDSIACYNSDFLLSNQTDKSILGFKTFDGFRANGTGLGTKAGENAGNFDLVNWLPLPEQQMPTPTQIVNFNINPLFDLDLDPDNNLSMTFLDIDFRYNSNFMSFEMAIDQNTGLERDIIIPQLISSQPPSGARSIKVGDRWVKYHMAKMTKTFIVSAEDPYYFYSYAMVMQDPNHDAWNQPYFVARVVDNACNELQQKTYISDINDPKFDFYNGYYPRIPGSNDGAIAYRQWACDSFDLSSYIGNEVTIEFITADCGESAHFGYAYVSDLCKSCREVPTILIDTLPVSCTPNNLIINGLLDLDTTMFIFQNLRLEFYNHGTLITTYNGGTFDPNTGNYQINVPNVFLNTLPQDSCFDVYAVASVLNSLNNLIDIRSKSANPNTADITDNDFCLGLEACCPNDTLNVDLDSTLCLGGIGIGEAKFDLNFTIDSLDLADGYQILLDQDLIFAGGYLENFTITKIPVNTYKITGIIHITDPAFVYGSDTILYGTLNYTNGSDTCILTLKFTFDSELKCGGCHDDTLMVDVTGSQCIGGEGVLENIFTLHFTIDTSELAPGYVIPLDQEFVIHGGYIDNFELDLLNNSQYVGTGMLHVTDPGFVFGSDPSVYGSLFYVKGLDTCELVVVMPFFWYNLKCNEYTILCDKLILDVRADTSYLGGTPYQVTMYIDMFLPFFESDSCDVTKWMIEANRIDGGIYYPLSPSYAFESPILPNDSLVTISFTMDYTTFVSMSALDLGFMNNCLKKSWCYTEIDPDEWLQIDSSSTLCDGLVRPSLSLTIIRDKNEVITGYAKSYILDLPFIELEDCDITSWAVSVSWTDTNSVVHFHSSFNYTNSTVFPYNLPLYFSASDWGKISSVKFILENNCRGRCEIIHYMGTTFLRKASKEVLKNKEKISLYPNPVNNILKVNIENASSDGTIEIYDTNGQLLQKSTILEKENHNINIDVSNFKSGVYLLRWNSNGNTLIKTFTVIK